ncbi:MAG: hypothetical protein CVU91_10155 [Firmicutes bacterium HGW-Firmicutes-16]|nr:MAG: hypothetical protein CVU91_10155 [Firmicutes bacterium HGW-Firmicutes-16]
MKNDNKGFTLIELMISLTIFAVLVTAVFSFMLAGSRSYSTVTNRLNLNVQSQLALNQLESYIIDCNAGLYYADNTLYIFNRGSSDTQYDVHVFKYDDASKQIKYGYGKNSANLVGGNFSCTVTAEDLLAENVTAFSVTTVSDGTRLTSATVSLVLTSNSASFNAQKTIALRNKPVAATLN